jgi:hypothetical protein
VVSPSRAAFVATAALAVVLSACVAPSKSDLENDTFAVAFENDLGTPIILALCQSDHSDICEHPHYRERIEVGRSLLENIDLTVPEEWAVTKRDGGLLRCVRLSFVHYPGHRPKVRLSDAAMWANPCPKTTWT